jgi:hypothetical protein
MATMIARASESRGSMPPDMGFLVRLQARLEQET